jgi:large subunit ribosomal protein L35
MPKNRTHKGAAKRFKITANGKIKRKRAFKSHILEKKSAKRKRRLQRPDDVSPADIRAVRRLLGK